MSLQPARFVRAAVFAALLCAQAFSQGAPAAAPPAPLPDRVGDFRAQPGAQLSPFSVAPLSPEDFSIVSTEARRYAGPGGAEFAVWVARTASAPDAYALLTYDSYGDYIPYRFGDVEGLGFARQTDMSVQFVRGANVIAIAAAGAKPQRTQQAVFNFAKQVAPLFEGEPAQTPVLLQHLPDWPSVGGAYATSLPALKHVVPDQPVLDAVSFEGGAEAAAARYDDGRRLVIVEFTTPQYSVENDARINARIGELRASGGPVPSGYRRVGNYSVFVFGAPDERAAVGLLDRVKYEKDVRWLGDNPHRGEMAERFYTMTMTGVIVTTLKATGLAILICLGVGGLFGGVVFLRRRARRTAAEAYTDAGGMLQLNIDEMKGARAKLLDEGGKG